VCVVARLQSPRTSSLAEVVRVGCPDCAIERAQPSILRKKATMSAPTAQAPISR
jgi:hypothetical protein